MAAGGRRRGMTIILIAVLLIVVVGGIYGYLTFFNKPSGVAQPLTQPTPSGELVDIVFTTQAIAKGTQFTEQVLTYVKYPRAELVTGTFITDMNEVIGKRAKIDLEARMPLTQGMVVDQPTGSLASFRIPTGMTAFSVPVTRESFVSYAPQMGDHVMVVGCMLLLDMDTNFQTKLPNYTSIVKAPGANCQDQNCTGVTVSANINTAGDPSKMGYAAIDPNLNMVTYAVPSEVQRPRMVCQTVIQDATILRVGDFSSELLPAASVDNQPRDQTAENAQTAAVVAAASPDIVSLIVTPQDVVLLNYLLSNKVQITMALRSAGDLQILSTQPVTLQFVMDQKNIQLPAKLPYGFEPRTEALNIPYPDWPTSGKNPAPAAQ
jgi:Flp pilus assembly protein CpaB